MKLKELEKLTDLVFEETLRNIQDTLYQLDTYPSIWVNVIFEDTKRYNNNYILITSLFEKNEEIEGAYYKVNFGDYDIKGFNAHNFGDYGITEEEFEKLK